MRRLALAIFWVLSGTTKDNPPDPTYPAKGLPNGGSGPYPEPSTNHAHAAPVIRAHSSTLLLLYSLVFVALGRFHRHLGRFNLLGQLLQLAMVGLPVATLVQESALQETPSHKALSHICDRALCDGVFYVGFLNYRDCKTTQLA